MSSTAFPTMVERRLDACAAVDDSEQALIDRLATSRPSAATQVDESL
jgi:hypothetical protein